MSSNSFYDNPQKTFLNSSYYGIDDFIESSENLLRNNQRNNLYSILVFDIDKFEEINNSDGIFLSNEVIALICSILECHIKEPNQYCYTNENFAILLENYKSIDVAMLVIQLSEEISNFFSTFKVKLSFGICIVNQSDQNISDLYIKACYAKSTIKGQNQQLLANYTELIIPELHILSF
jgi:GGDEF domain-containing protein